MKRILSILFVLSLFAGMAIAQTTDSTKVEYTEETTQNSDFSLNESYNYLIRAQVEEKSLLKLGITNFGFGGGKSYLTYAVAYEKKLHPSFSVMGEFRHRVSQHSQMEPVVSFNAGGRYYYNLNNRIRKGKSANNFSANYFGLSQQNPIVHRENNYKYEPSLLLVYGLQRRIGKYGYFDFNFGPGYEHQSGERNFIFEVDFSIGLAF